MREKVAPRKPYEEPDFDGFMMFTLSTGEPKWLYLVVKGEVRLLGSVDYTEEVETNGQPMEQSWIRREDLGEHKFREVIEAVIKQIPANPDAPFAKALRETMVKGHVSMRDAAIVTGVPVVRISDLRRGNAQPTIEEVEALAALCGARLSEWSALAAEQGREVEQDERA